LHTTTPTTERDASTSARRPGLPDGEPDLAVRGDVGGVLDLPERPTGLLLGAGFLAGTGFLDAAPAVRLEEPSPRPVIRRHHSVTPMGPL
jgi:hypothetical protein